MHVHACSFQTWVGCGIPTEILVFLIMENIVVVFFSREGAEQGRESPGRAAPYSDNNLV